MRSSLVFILFLLILIPLVGCNRKTEPPPITQKVGGTVVFKDAKPFSGGGTIEFRHETKSGATAISGILPDGKFDLFTMTAQHKVPGAQEGSYTVTITPASEDQNVQPINIKKKYVIAVGENELTVVID